MHKFKNHFNLNPAVLCISTRNAGQAISGREPVEQGVFPCLFFSLRTSGGALARQASFFFPIPHSCLFLPPPHQTIWSTFSPCLRIWPILCTQLMTMARVVVGSGGSDILCC